MVPFFEDYSFDCLSPLIDQDWETRVGGEMSRLDELFRTNEGWVWTAGRLLDSQDGWWAEVIRAGKPLHAAWCWV